MITIYIRNDKTEENQYEVLFMELQSDVAW